MAPPKKNRCEILGGLFFCVIKLGGGFKYFLFSPLFGEDDPILTVAYCSNGLVKNHQLENCRFLPSSPAFRWGTAQLLANLGDAAWILAAGSEAAVAAVLSLRSLEAADEVEPWGLGTGFWKSPWLILPVIFWGG